MEKQLKKLTKTYNVKLQDMTDIGLDYGVEIARKLIIKSGLNPCVPKKGGKAIYQGGILFFKGKSFDECLNQAIKYINNKG